MRKLITTVAALVMVAAMFQAGSVKAGGPAKPSSQSKSGVAVAYAKANIGTLSLLSFGGKGTTSAAVTGGVISNYVDITFTGKYPKDITADQVILNATAKSYDFGVANTEVVSVNPTQLVISVSGWISTNTVTHSGETVFVTVYMGY
jgi:hypothetical protein